MSYLATNLKYLRKSNSVTQSDIALHLNKGQSTIGNWENELSEPNITELKFLAHFFGITISDLLEVDLSNVHLNQKEDISVNKENVHLNVRPNVHLNTKKAPKGAGFKPALNEDNTPFKDQLLQSKTELIDSLQAQIKLLQNQIDQMKYDTTEREQKQHAQRKEARSA